MTSRYRVLGLHPFAHGFGWIVFEQAHAPLDWGVVEKKTGDRNTQCLFAVERIVKRYQPDAIALEVFDAPQRPRVPRIQHLCRSIAARALGENIELAVYPLAAIRLAMVGSGAASRYMIAAAVAQRIDAIRARLPKKRAIWESEKPNMALFSAAAVALTHYAHDAENLPPEAEPPVHPGAPE